MNHVVITVRGELLDWPDWHSLAILILIAVLPWQTLIVLLLLHVA